MINRQFILSLAATLTVGGVAGGVITHRIMVSAQVTCPMSAEQPLAPPPLVENKTIPQGFLGSNPLPMTGKQY